MVDQVRRLVLKGLIGSGIGAAFAPMFSSTAFAAGDALPEPLSAPVLAELRRRAARLANYGSFGANEATVTGIIDSGWEAWVDEQLALPITPVWPGSVLDEGWPTKGGFFESWWTNAVLAPDQLHQRVGFALSQWFVVSFDHPILKGHNNTIVDFYDLLLNHVNGNFADLLFKVSTHPAMCTYLSSLYNEKGDPEQNTFADENYAREVMQLFTLGAEKRYASGRFALDAEGNRIPNYTEDDVLELARVFTGMGLAGTNWGSRKGDWVSPMIEYPDHHDSGAKQLLGKSIPAGLGIFQDIQAALDILMTRRKDVAGNFSRFMIQRLTVSNPRTSYVKNVALAFRDSAWDLPTLVRAIMLHPDAVDGRSDSKSETGRIKEPLLWYASARRAIAPTYDQALAPVTGPLVNGGTLKTATSFNQAPMGAPHVFGFFPWNFQPDEIAGEGTQYIDYVYPEAYLYNVTNVVRITNVMWGDLIKRGEEDVQRFMDAARAAADNAEFADFVLDQVLFGNHRQALREEMIALLDTRGNDPQGKLRDALMLAIASPDFLHINVPQEVSA